MKCTLCGQNFECHSDKNCWCFDFPRIEIRSQGDQCMCNNCLISSMAEAVNDAGFELSDEMIFEIGELGIPKNLIEGVDYYINDEGNYVFSRWYLLRRAYCCNNGCKHCPY